MKTYPQHPVQSVSSLASELPARQSGTQLLPQFTQDAAALHAAPAAAYGVSIALGAMPAEVPPATTFSSAGVPSVQTSPPPQASLLSLRGTVLKVPDASPGLLFVNGNQHPFVLEGLWRSPVAPTPNQIVDVALDAAGRIAWVAVVSDEILGREQLLKLGSSAQVHGARAAASAGRHLSLSVARMGTVPFVAAVTVVAAWFFLPALNFGFLSLTFWEGVSFDPLRRSGSLGLGSILGLAAIAAPFAVPYLKGSKAPLLFAAPLVFVVVSLAITLAKVWDVVQPMSATMDAMRGAAGTQLVAATPDTSVFQFLGYGIFVLLIAAGVLALQARRALSSTQ